MLRTMLRRAKIFSVLVGALAVTLVGSSSCGGGGFAPKELALVEFLFVDRALNPTAPTGTTNLPRNAQILLVFTELIDPATVNEQTIQVRFGPTFSSVPTGSFSVDGNTVRFDPTVTAQGEPNPFGFEPVTQYTVDIPNFEDQTAVVRSLGNDPNLTTFFSSFVTGDGFLAELDAPSVLSVFFIPDPHPVTGQIPGNGTMVFEFSEPMDPATFILGGSAGPEPGVTCIDVRYAPFAQINIDNNLVVGGVGAPIPGFFTHNAGATQFFFHPTFSFGDNEFVFTAEVFQCLKDLPGNQLINPRSFGPFVCDGNGLETGKLLEERFESVFDMDAAASDADWGFMEEGIGRGQPVTSRQATIFGYAFTIDSSIGQYAALPDPLNGYQLNNFITGINPPTAAGRRELLSFSDAEIGPDGAITGAGWGADSNATFAAKYPNVILRAGYQVSNQLNLVGNIEGNYAGSPTVLYNGQYVVAQKANVGNTPGHPTFPHTPGYPENPGCQVGGWNAPLFSATGFAAWPTFANFFEWTEGDPAVENDRVLLFDQSVQEGDWWQQIRAWFGVTFPCSGILIGGFPRRRLRSTYEGTDPDPPENFGLGILNPEPTVVDTSFTVTKRQSVAQVLFYTDGAQPGNSVATTFGDASDYLPVQLTPAVQSGGAKVIIEFQGADLVEADRRTINQAGPFMPTFSNDINDCDGFRCIRWRAFLISNLVNGQVARLDTVQIPVLLATN